MPPPQRAASALVWPALWKDLDLGLALFMLSVDGSLPRQRTDRREDLNDELNGMSACSAVKGVVVSVVVMPTGLIIG